MEPSVINSVISEYIVPVIKKDGIFQVYRDCPTPNKGNRCHGIAQCLDGPPPEYKRSYRCGACQTEYTYDELAYIPLPKGRGNLSEVFGKNTIMYLPRISQIWRKPVVYTMWGDLHRFPAILVVDS